MAAAAEELPMVVDTFRIFAGAARCIEDYKQIKHVMAKVA